MMTTLTSSLQFFAMFVFLVEAQLPRTYDEPELLPLATGPLAAVLSGVLHPHCSVVFFSNGYTSATAVSMLVDQVGTSRAVGLFEVAADVQDANVTQEQLSRLVGEARRLRQLSWCVRVVVVSDDPAFLAAFAQWCLKGHLLVWSTRLLIVTRLPLHHLHHLHNTLSTTNSMLLIVRNTTGSLSCGMYVHLPYSPRGVQPLLVASWTSSRGLLLTTNLPLFPDKFEKFHHQPILVATTEVNPINKMTSEDNAAAPGGKRYTFTGPMPKLMDYLATALNFSYIDVRPPDGSWGLRYDNGSWSGMVGMVSREVSVVGHQARRWLLTKDGGYGEQGGECSGTQGRTYQVPVQRGGYDEQEEADIGIGPFAVSGNRAEVVDFTWPILIEYSRIISGRGRPEVDPWGFLLPLAPLVWAAILTMLLMLPIVTSLVSSCILTERNWQGNWLKDFFAFVRVFLQQDICVVSNWWWERLVLGLWMMTTLVLTRSYAGNLMSLLAVRHIPQPYQTIGDFLADPSATIIWESGSSIKRYLYSARTGVYRSLDDLGKEGRVLYVKREKFTESIDTLVRQGDHVLMDAYMSIQVYLAEDFTRTGKCSFYKSTEEVLPTQFAMIGQKDSPLVQALSKRIITMTEAGMFKQWLKTEEPNAQVCEREAAHITVRASLALSNTWGMFAILIGGYVLCLSVFSFEGFVALIIQFYDK